MNCNHQKRNGTVAVLVALLVLFSQQAMTATIVVDEATCTLVDAITAANTDSPVGGCATGSGADTIELTTDVTLTGVNNVSEGRNGLPVIDSAISIEGGGFTIARDVGASKFRLFYVTGELSLNKVTLTGGDAPDSDDCPSPDGCPPGDAKGGGILNRGSLTLTNCTVANNRTFGRQAIGGGIVSIDGTLVVANSTLVDNFVGARYAECPHVWGEVAVGGGFAVLGGAASVTNSTLSGNQASGLRVNCVTGETQGTGFGSGIAVSGGSVSVTSSTLSNNSALPWDSGGGCIDGNNISVADSIVACLGTDCRGTIIDEGKNFADGGSCGPGFADITPGADFDTTLSDNGGPTPTLALLPGSVAIDAAGDCDLDTDQRGFLRWDGACDSGAFERGAQPPNLPPEAACSDVTVAASEECLAGADVDVGSFDPDGDPITLNQDPPGPYTLGDTPVTLTVTDDQGASNSCVATVTVVDESPPELAVTLMPNTLWPPNHHMVDVEASWSVSDNCSTVTVVLTSITSNESDNGEDDGNTTNDIQGAEVGTADADFQLRAERAGGGDGRIYTAAYSAMDAAGNTRTEAGFTVVPHDQGGTIDPIEASLSHDAYGTWLSWSSVAGAESYNVIRGLLSELEETDVVIGLGVVTCIEEASTDTSTAGFEDVDTPGPGEAFFYLVEYFDGTSSSYGTESASKPRAPAQGECQ